VLERSVRIRGRGPGVGTAHLEDIGVAGGAEREVRGADQRGQTVRGECDRLAEIATQLAGEAGGQDGVRSRARQPGVPDGARKMKAASARV
jgi:hypothetical protein